MDKIRRSLSILFILLFLLGIVLIAYFLFLLPDKLIHSVDALNNNNIDQASTALNQIYLIVGLELLFGLGIITLTLMGKQSETAINIDKSTATDILIEEEEEENEVDVEKLADESKNLVKELNEIVKGKGERKEKFDQVLAHICKNIEASQGVIYTKAKVSNKIAVKLYSAYAFTVGESEELSFELGEGIVGQVAKEGKTLIIDSVPEGHMEIFSGLGNASPTHLLVIPLKKKNEIVGVAEFSSFKVFNSIDQQKVQDGVLVLENIAQEKSAAAAAKKPKAATAKKNSDKKSGS